MKKSFLSAVSFILAMVFVFNTPMRVNAWWWNNSNQDIVVNTGAEYVAPMLDVPGVGGEGKQTETVFKANQYYYKTGLSCPKEATYSKYKLLERVKKGDVIYEAMGAGGLAGHIAIVEGVFDRGDGTKYIRLIESIGDGGTVRSILDDKRADVKQAYVLRVYGASQTNINRALAFCIGQMGKGYRMDLKWDFNYYQPDWYCSELVWAAYFNQGINIETTGAVNEPGVTPRDIYRCSLMLNIPYK